MPLAARSAGRLAEPAEDDAVPRDRLRVQVLGPAVITGAAREPQPKQTELVVALALHTPPGLTGSALATMLGRDPDHPKPRDILRQLITRTRRRLGGPGDGRDYIRYQDGRYTLTGAWLDWAAFTALARRGGQDSSRASVACRPQPGARRTVRRRLLLVAGGNAHDARRDASRSHRRRGAAGAPRARRRRSGRVSLGRPGRARS